MAQGTHWAVAVTQAFLSPVRFPLHPHSLLHDHRIRDCSIRPRGSHRILLVFWARGHTRMPSIIAHLLLVFFSETHVSGLAAVLFSHHAGSVVLNCGHTPGQHAQYHYTPAAEVQLFFLSWLMALRPPPLHHHHLSHQHTRATTGPAAAS